MLLSRSIAEGCDFAAVLFFVGCCEELAARRGLVGSVDSLCSAKCCFMSCFVVFEPSTPQVTPTPTDRTAVVRTMLCRKARCFCQVS